MEDEVWWPQSRRGCVSGAPYIQVVTSSWDHLAEKSVLICGRSRKEVAIRSVSCLRNHTCISYTSEDVSILPLRSEIKTYGDGKALSCMRYYLSSLADYVWHEETHAFPHYHL